MGGRTRGGTGNRRIRRSFLLTAAVFFLFAFIYYLDVTGGNRFFHPIHKYQWKEEYGELNGPDVSGTDGRVLEKLRSRFLFPPVKDTPYNLSLPFESDPSMGQSSVIRRLFDTSVVPGFFIECGALDGETRSNTLFIERNLLWEGLLIEADPSNFNQLKWKHRKAFTSPACLSTNNYPSMVSFEQKENQGKISSFSAGYVQPGFVDVQCFPLTSFLIALNITTVDYLSLDVEGAELDILKTIDFDKFNFKTLSVEFIHDVEGKEAIVGLMESRGFFTLTEVTHPDWLANDLILVQRNFFASLPLWQRSQLLNDFPINSYYKNGDPDHENTIGVS